MRNELLGLKKALDEKIDLIGGCTDGNCVVKKPTGAHTNGGCRCVNDTSKMRRVLTAINCYVEDLNKLLNSVPRASA